MSETVLEMESVTSGYMGDIDVLRNVSLSVRAGAISGLIGLNGSPITGRQPHTLIDEGLWYIPQESSLFPYLSVRDNLRLALEGRGKVFGSVLEARFEETLREFPLLREKLNAQAGDLSGGQQKSLEFAKAYMVRPRVCLIDEPSIGLAPRVAADVFQWIRRFAESGMGILLVDHNVRRVVEMADHVYVLSLGEITASGSPDDFRGDLHAQVREWLGINF